MPVLAPTSLQWQLNSARLLEATQILDFFSLACHVFSLPLKFTTARSGLFEVDLLPELLHQLSTHEHVGESELTRCDGAYWARQCS